MTRILNLQLIQSISLGPSIRRCHKRSTDLQEKQRKTDTTEHYDVFCHFNKLKKSILTSLNSTKDECSVFVNFQRIILELTTVVDGRKGQVEA